MRSNIAWAGGAFLAALALGTCLYPDRFIFFRFSWINYADSMLSHAGAFWVTNSLYLGGVQLWDWNDQMPMTFFHFNTSLYKLSNVLTAIFYYIFSPLSSHPAQFFYQLHSWMFLAAALIVRIVGCYLLATLFCDTKWLVFGVTIYGALILQPQFMTGLSTNIIYSLYPMLMYFVLRFVQSWELDYFLLFVMTWVYCFATDLFCGLGYLYQGTHLFILSSLGWAVWRHRKTGFHAWRQYWNRENRHKILWVVGLSLLMLAPTLGLIKGNYSDYEFGLEHSRMKNPMSISAYFQRPIALAPASEFLWRMVDYTDNKWTLDWLFIGMMGIFLSIFALVVGKDSRRFIFLGTAVLFFLVNNPREGISPGAMAHWLNALTNPLKFLPRSYHMSCALLLPFVILPLVAYGAQLLWDCLAQKGALSSFSHRLISFILLVFVLSTFTPLPNPAKGYLLVSAAGFSLVVFLLKSNSVFTLRIAGIILVFLLLLDISRMRLYVNNEVNTNLVETHMIGQRPELGEMMLDYQNPRISPWRDYYSIMDWGKTVPYLFEAPFNMPGIYYAATNMLRYYQPISNYLPRHKAFDFWNQDNGMYYYIKDDPRMIFEAKIAVLASGQNFVDILTHGLSRDVVMIEGKPESLGLLKEVPSLQPSKSLPIDMEASLLKDPKMVMSENNLKWIQYSLPSNFPANRSSTFLTPDEGLIRIQLVSPSGQARELTPSQGPPSSFFAFDINNVREGFLTIALPQDFKIDDKQIRVGYPKVPSQGLIQAIHRLADQWELSYKAQEPGWLVIHQPFDLKWEILLDGKKIDFYRANKSFVAFPITEGKHQILMRYWPHTWIRWAIIISTILSIVVLSIIMIKALK